MKLVITVLIAVAFSGALYAHPDHVESCDYRLLDGDWDVFYPGGDPGLEDTARLTIVGSREDEKSMFDIKLKGDDKWSSGVRVEQEACLPLIGPVVGFEIVEKTATGVEATTKKICVHRIGSLLGLMKSERGGEANPRQIGIYEASDDGTCVSRDKDDRPVEKMTPGHAHADD